MVPAGLIKKMYGSSIFTDEVLKSVEKELYTYLNKEKPEIFGQPLPLSSDLSNMDINDDGTIANHAPRKSFAQAASQIVVADVSMSLDNVLAVAGAAREHFTVLIIGLGLSVALMGIAASYIARLLHRHQWIAYAGLLVILYVAVEMVYRGMGEVWPLITHS